MGRIIVAALVGGLLEFGWGALSHMGLGIHDADVEKMPNEGAVLDELKATPAGHYFVPWLDHASATEEDTKAWSEKAKSTAAAMVVRWPADAVSADPQPKQLGFEFVTNFLGALVLAAIGAGRAFSGRVALGAMAGVFAFLSEDASYWIWYHFSDAMTRAQLIDSVAGWTIASIGIAFVMSRKPRA
jgi:hypothetical protein